MPKKNNHFGTQEPGNLSGKDGSTSSRRLFAYLRQVVPQMRPFTGVVGLGNGILNTGATNGSFGTRSNLKALYNVQPQILNQQMLQPARVIQRALPQANVRYVQRPPQYNVPQQMNRYRAPPQQYRPQYMPQQAQQQYTPQPQGFMPQVQPMRVPQIPCNCGKKGQMTKTIVSGGKKVKVTVKKNGKANATVTAAKGSKVKVSKAPKVVAKKKKAKLGVFSRME